MKKEKNIYILSLFSILLFVCGFAQIIEAQTKQPKTTPTPTASQDIQKYTAELKKDLEAESDINKWMNSTFQEVNGKRYVRTLKISNESEPGYSLSKAQRLFISELMYLDWRVEKEEIKVREVDILNKVETDEWRGTIYLTTVSGKSPISRIFQACGWARYTEGFYGSHSVLLITQIRATKRNGKWIFDTGDQMRFEPLKEEEIKKALTYPVLEPQQRAAVLMNLAIDGRCNNQETENIEKVEESIKKEAAEIADLIKQKLFVNCDNKFYLATTNSSYQTKRNPQGIRGVFEWSGLRMNTSGQIDRFSKKNEWMGSVEVTSDSLSQYFFDKQGNKWINQTERLWSFRPSVMFGLIKTEKQWFISIRGDKQLLSRDNLKALSYKGIVSYRRANYWQYDAEFDTPENILSPDCNTVKQIQSIK